MVYLSLLLFSLATLAPALAANGITAVGAGFSSELGNAPMPVTVHYAEFGDEDSTTSRINPPEPVHPEPPPAPKYVGRGFNYGQDLRYRPGTRQESRAYDYTPRTRLVRGAFQPEAGLRLRRRYEGTGKRMRSNYRPQIEYGENVRRKRRRHRFGAE